MILSMVQLFGPICVDPEDGGRLCSEIHALLDSGDSVCLDFCGVSTVTSSFLNTAIGCLYAGYQPNELAARLSYTGLDPTDEAILRLVQPALGSEERDGVSSDVRDRPRAEKSVRQDQHDSWRACLGG